MTFCACTPNAEQALNQIRMVEGDEREREKVENSERVEHNKKEKKRGSRLGVVVVQGGGGVST